jgi:DNA-binding winged helix-turn-helix (wHTH) protein/tetratricopeptide (TPR) repeat protein
VSAERLFRRGSPIHLTSKAFRLLLFFVSKPGVTLRTEEIMATLWAEDERATEQTLRQHVLMVRHALEDNVTERYIVSEYGCGYRFTGEVTERPPSYMADIVDQYCVAASEFQRSSSPAGMIAALHMYERALSIDDSSANALGGAALTRILMADFQYDRPRELLETAQKQAGAALLLRPNCIDAMLALCKVRLDYFWEFERALRLAQCAGEIDPANRIAAFMYPWILILSSRFSEAAEFIDRLPQAISALNVMVTCRALATLFSGDYDAGRIELAAASCRWPDYWFARTFFGLALILVGNERDALRIFDEVRLSAYDPLVDNQMNARYFAEGYALYTRFRLGDVKAAEAGLERLARLSESQFIPATIFALAEIGRQNYGEARKYISQCRDNRECWYTHLAVDPLVKELRLDVADLYRPTRRGPNGYSITAAL